MKNWVSELKGEKVELQIAPLIDVVFLLLIYFMVSAQLQRPEADLGLSLPGEVSVLNDLIMLDEQIIEISNSGHITLNDQIFRGDDIKQLQRLKGILIRYKLATDQLSQPASIIIDADSESQHEDVVSVLNVCAAANIEQISFGSFD